MNFKSAHIQAAVFAVTIAVLAGCGDHKPKLSVNDHFRPDDEARAVHNIFDSQAAIAAREDGQLYAHHFTGAVLNSLGRQKLGAMTAGREVGKLDVYLSLPKDGDYAGRQTSVIKFLQGRGLSDSAFAINDGPNPKVGAPAAQGLSGLGKQQGGGDAAPAVSVGTK